MNNLEELRILKLSLGESSEEKEICYVCSKELEYGDINELDGVYFCNRDYAEQMKKCDNCDNEVDREALTEVMVPGGGDKLLLCGTCIDEECVLCDDCRNIVRKKDCHESDGDWICDSCFENYGFCNGCNKMVSYENMNLGTDGDNYCDECYGDRYFNCSNCGESCELIEAMGWPEDGMRGDVYCGNCAPEGTVSVGPTGKVENLPIDYRKYEGKVVELGYSTEDRNLSKLRKYLPISVRELKRIDSGLANSLVGLIRYCGGKDLTEELVEAYRDNVGVSQYPLSYSTWGGIQRSVKDKDEPQLVLNVIVSEDMLEELGSMRGLLDVFNMVNAVSKRSGHPFVENQLGWVRMELNEVEKYILIDEVQSDHMNASHELRDGSRYSDIRQTLMNRYELGSEELDKLLVRYGEIVREFPDIAYEAVIKFARENGYEKLYNHTYESGKMLKNNNPPKSMYNKVPRRHYFNEGEGKPFGLDGRFMEREAGLVELLRLSGVFYKKAISSEL